MNGHPWDATRPPSEIVTDGTDAERWWLSGREDLSRNIFSALVEGSNHDVAASLALNYSTPPDLLERLAELHPDLHWIIAVNPNAAPRLKESAPLGSHSQDSINRYLDAKDATPGERRQLVALYESGPHPGIELLGVVWARIHERD